MRLSIVSRIAVVLWAIAVVGGLALVGSFGRSAAVGVILLSLAFGLVQTSLTCPVCHRPAHLKRSKQSVTADSSYWSLCMLQRCPKCATDLTNVRWSRDTYRPFSKVRCHLPPRPRVP